MIKKQKIFHPFFKPIIWLGLELKWNYYRPTASFVAFNEKQKRKKKWKKYKQEADCIWTSFIVSSCFFVVKFDFGEIKIANVRWRCISIHTTAVIYVHRKLYSAWPRRDFVLLQCYHFVLEMVFPFYWVNSTWESLAAGWLNIGMNFH